MKFAPAARGPAACRRATALALCGLFVVPGLCALPVQGASAATKKSTTQKETSSTICGGQDMLPELAKSDPNRFQRILNAAAKSANARAVFWQVSKPGIAPSYLFGTIHLTDPRVIRLSPAVRTALRSATTVALEVADLSPTAMARAISRAAELALYTDGSSLKSKLSPDNYAKVEHKLKSAGMPVQTAKVLRPWVITMLLASSDCERKRAQSGKLTLDMQIADIAKRNAIPVVGLETLDGQLQALAASTQDDQMAMLRAGLAYIERSNDLVETLIQLYLTRKNCRHLAPPNCPG